MTENKKKVLLASASAILPAAAMAVYLLAAPQPAQASMCVCYYNGAAYSPGAIVLVNTNPPICLTCSDSGYTCSWSRGSC